MRDRRDPREISQDLLIKESNPRSTQAHHQDTNGVHPPKSTELADAGALRPGPVISKETDAELMAAASAGLDSPLAKFFSWLGSHFFGVTLVLTGVFLFWALR